MFQMTAILKNQKHTGKCNLFDNYMCIFNIHLLNSILLFIIHYYILNIAY